MTNVPLTSSASGAGQAGGPGGPSAPRPPLLAVPDEALPWLWQGWVAALEPALYHWSQTPAGTRHALPPRVLDYLGTGLREGVLRDQPPENVLRLLRLDLTVGRDILEAFILDGRDERWHSLLAACCTRIGQLYSELKRRFGVFFALTALRRGLKQLSYPSTPAVADLVRERAGDGAGPGGKPTPPASHQAGE